jgi:hypothetical protein
MSGSMTRRGVLTGAAAIAGVTALPQFLSARAAAIRDVVVDERLAQSAQFARGVAASGVHAVDALDDLCNRWYTQLRKKVLADAGHIAGLTTWMDYVVIRGCAAEIGYAGAFHAEHVPLGAAGVAHAVTAYPDVLSSLTRLATPRSWAQVMGKALASGTHLRSRFVPGAIFNGTTAAPAGHVRMVSWVFSPRA